MPPRFAASAKSLVGIRALASIWDENVSGVSARTLSDTVIEPNADAHRKKMKILRSFL